MKTACALLVVGTMLIATDASAGRIVVPVAVSVSSPDPANPSNNILDQSGLSERYVAGVTDFDPFVRRTTATSTSLSVLGGAGGPPSYFEFDFGGLVTLDRIAVWNQWGTAALDTFTVETASLADFSDSWTSPVFKMSVFRGAMILSADVFDFGPRTLRYLRVNTLTNAGFADATRVNEFAFRQADVPEPALLSVFAAGLFGLLVRRGSRLARGR